jgi:hypothetical protein
LKPERLVAAEYTLVTLVLAKTQATVEFTERLHRIKRKVVESCLKEHRPDYQRAELVLLRVTQFDDQVHEVHGFLPLPQVDAGGYVTSECKGRGQLHVAAFEAVGVTTAFARTLAERDYLVNGLVVVVTCDWDDGSAKSLERATGATRGEAGDGNLESLKTILIDVASQGGEERRHAVSKALGFSADLGTDDADDLTIDRVVEFIAREVVATSQALGTGGPSKAAKW